MPITQDETLEHFGSRAIIQLIPTPVEILTKIDNVLTKFATWGLNPEKISTRQFEIATFFVSDPNHSAVHARIYIIFKSLATKRLEPHDVDLISTYGAYPTVMRLIQLAQKEA